MNSPSLLDYFAEKVHSYSTKMKGDSLLHYNSSFLMPGNSISQNDPVRIINDLREYGILENPHHRTMILNQLLEELGAYQSRRHLHNVEKNEVFSSVKNTIFSPHFLNLMSALNSFCFKSHFDKSFIPCSTSITGNMNNFFSRSHPFDFETESDLKQNCNLPVSNSKMSTDDTVACSVLPAAQLQQIKADDKCTTMSASVKLNLKLTNRKTKQINRRSRNRRRRQKKGMHVGFPSSASSSSDDSDDNNDCNGNVQCPVSSSVSIVAKSPSFECTVSFQHTTQVPSLVSSFVLPVESDSEDDSDWVSYGETDYLHEKNCQVSTLHCGVLSSETCSETSDSSDCSASDDDGKSCGFSFVVPSDTSSDDGDDDDWDTCDASDLADVAEFEFTGLFVTNLCSLRKVPAIIEPEPETVEIVQMRKEVLEANKKWNELKDVEKKSTSKIAFAVDEDLVTIFHVEMFDRKGEWEIYATERLRFKRRIDELENVLSPCLDPEHRSKIFKKFIEPDL